MPVLTCARARPARVIAAVLGVPLEIEPNLYERDVGALQGKPYDSILTTPGYDPKRGPRTWKPEGGESFEEVETRVGPILDRLAEAHLTRDVVVVSHGGVMKTLWAYITGDWDGAHVPPNCGMILVEYGPGGYSPPQSSARARCLYVLNVGGSHGSCGQRTCRPGRHGEPL